MFVSEIRCTFVEDHPRRRLVINHLIYINTFMSALKLHFLLSESSVRQLVSPNLNLIQNFKYATLHR